MEEKIKTKIREKAMALWGPRWLQELASSIDEAAGRKPGASVAALYKWFGQGASYTITTRKLAEIISVLELTLNG